MPGPPVTIGTAVVLIPGAAGPPDSGTIMAIFQAFVTANGLPLATSGSLCMMVNSVTGAPYTLPIGIPASSGVSIGGQALVRMGDVIPSGPGMLTILGPPVSPAVMDQWPP